MRGKNTILNRFFWLGTILLAFSASTAEGQSTVRMTDDPEFYFPSEEPKKIPVLMDPDQFRVRTPKQDSSSTSARIGDVIEQKNDTANAVERRTDAAKKKIARSPAERESPILNALPTANLSAGLRAYPMQRSTYNRVNLLDYNRSFQAGYLAPQQRSPDAQVTFKTWRSPDMVHNPLYFEEANLERYGNTRGRLQPFYSGLHFFSAVATLPYKKGVRPPRDCEFSLGHYRPGDCNPAYRPTLERNGKALIRQGLVVGAAIGL